MEDVRAFHINICLEGETAHPLYFIMVRTRPTYIYLPDTAAGWPFPRTVNPYYEETKAESEAWISSLYPFDAYVQKKFNAEGMLPALLASMAYPWLSKGDIILLPWPSVVDNVLNRPHTHRRRPDDGQSTFV